MCNVIPEEVRRLEFITRVEIFRLSNEFTNIFLGNLSVNKRGIFLGSDMHFCMIFIGIH